MNMSDTSLKKCIGTQIKDFRIARGFSQQELSELLGKGFSQTLVNFFEKGEREIKTTSLVKLAKILEVSPNALLGFEEDKILIEIYKNKEFLYLIRDNPKEQIKKIVDLLNNVNLFHKG